MMVYGARCLTGNFKL